MRLGLAFDRLYSAQIPYDVGVTSYEAFGALEAAPLANLRTIEFVLRDERCYAAFADAAHERWGRR